MRAIRQTVRVLPGGRIELTDPALEEGMDVEVIVLIPEPDDEPEHIHPEGG